MIERTAGCLESGIHAFPRGPKPQKHLRSRRHLHFAFWSHGAGDIDLPSWWRYLLQAPVSSGESRSSQKKSSGLQYIFLDFLYPVQSWTLIRQLKRSTNAHHRAAQNIKIASRNYTSIAADLVVEANKNKAKETQVEDASVSVPPVVSQPGDAIRRGINEILDSKDQTGLYDELWQSYQTLLRMSQALSGQKIIRLLRCLGASKRTIDVERCIALFESIPISERRAIHYSLAVPAALTLKDLDTAIDIHREASQRINGSIGTEVIFRYAVQHKHWQAAVNIWYERWFDKLRLFTRPDIWTGVRSLPLSDMIERATSAADFAISMTKSTVHDSAMAARDFAIELIRHTLNIQDTTFDVDKHWHLVQKARTLDPSDVKTQVMALQQLLSVNSKQSRDQALQLYCIVRKEETFSPSKQMLSDITTRLVAEKNDSGILMMLDDWRTYFNGLPAHTAIDVAAVLAQNGHLEALQRLFRGFCFEHGKPKNHGLYHSLILVHNRRADPDGVVHTFNYLQKEFGFKPTLRAWNAVIATFARVGDVYGALEWFTRLQTGTNLKADSHTYFSLMSMYGRRGDLVAVIDLYQQSKVAGVRTTLPMVDTFVLAHINAGNLADAEQLVTDALNMEFNGSRTFMWNILLNTHALRKDLESVSRLYKQMQEAGVPPDNMTYAALMTSLTISKQVAAANKLLTKVMPRIGVKATSLHYAIVMGGYLAVNDHGKVFEIYKNMLDQGLQPTMSTQNILLRAAALVDKADEHAEEKSESQKELPRAQQTLDQILSNLDPVELAVSEPRKFVGPNPLNEAFSSTYFEYLIFLYGKDGAFTKVSGLYERYISTSARFGKQDVETSPPMRLTSALMAAHLRAGDYGEVERCWYLALVKSEALACRAKANTTSPGWVLNSRRFIINLPLHQYITCLGRQSRINDLIGIVNELHSWGYALNSPNWNLYIQSLARSPHLAHQDLAFKLCERELMPNWPGWEALGNFTFVKKKLRAMTRSGLLLPDQKMPAYVTLVQLAAVYLQAREGTRHTTVRRLASLAPRTVEALNKMPRLADGPQNQILRS